jgi:protein gp37
MTVLKTGISWTNTTINPTWGCTKVSAGCDFCYAEAINDRLGKNPFEEIRYYPKRLEDIRAMKPLRNAVGEVVPRMVFLNSMSDIFHEQIPDTFRDQVFDAMEDNPITIFQLLTKRPGVAGRYLRRRYGHNRAPFHLWFGTSIENNDVAKRTDVLRDIKARHNVSCAFLSVEPLIGPIDKVDFSGCDWILIGGESGPKCRPMALDWLKSSIDKSRAANAAIWFKQYGHPKNNPYAVRIAKEERITIQKAFQLAIARGLEKEPDEKGGATLDGHVYHELPTAWHALKHELGKAKIEGNLEPAASGRLL